jgi:KDO2-lipid IV(A) lauroyltransferase
LTALRHAVEAAAFGVLYGLARVLPRRALLGLGGLVGSVASRFESARRGVTLSNLRAALGEQLEEPQLRRIARACWRHFGRISFETLGLRVSPESIADFVEVEGLEHARAAYAKGRGVLLFTGHYGHWELLNLVHGALGMKMTVVVRPIDNPWIDRTINALRRRTGNEVIRKRDAAREMLRTLRAGGAVGLLIDQDARHQGVFVPFFGRPASTTPALALVALRTGVPVIPFYCRPVGDGRYRLTYEPPVELPSGEDREDDVVRLTARCTAILESWVRREPEYWLWMHRRWKTRPEDTTNRRG